LHPPGTPRGTGPQCLLSVWPKAARLLLALLRVRVLQMQGGRRVLRRLRI